VSNHRNKQLGDFLRYHRARLTPSQVGLPSTTRRRTVGLRREEVASLIGISTTWYTSLEQGRNIQVSQKVLEKLAQLFQLSYQERLHLFSLANNLPQLNPYSSDAQPSPLLQRMLDYHSPSPAYLLSMRWDIIGWNEAACSVFPMMSHFYTRSSRGLDRNLVYLMFTDPQSRELIRFWERHAQSILRHFRIDYTQYGEHVNFEPLIHALNDQTLEFTEWWECPDIGIETITQKELNHPLVGHLILEQSIYLVVDNPGLKMVLDVPYNQETYCKLQHLQATDKSAKDCTIDE
jgi:transcriptional regulator with XRE-family HTH domain